MINFRELRVWQQSIALVKQVYTITKKFPDNERYGLVSQMRRSAISIPSNIAEGHLRGTKKEFRQFISIARGSCAELETQLTLARELDFIDGSTQEAAVRDISFIAKILSSLYGKLQKMN